MNRYDDEFGRWFAGIDPFQSMSPPAAWLAWALGGVALLAIPFMTWWSRGAIYALLQSVLGL